MMAKYYLDTVGCRLNQSEIEIYARQLRAAGHTLVADPADADVAIVNTCMVTAAASADSRKKIRHIARAGTQSIMVTGCWASLKPEDARALPNVSQVVFNCEKDDLVAKILKIDKQAFDLEFIAREPIPGSRARTRAFIKVQDGCNNKCTYCVTTVARGKSVSRTEKAILADIRAAQQGGSQEIVLTGVHMGSWGYDFDRPRHLRDLIETVLAETDVPRLRLSSLEPWDLDEGFLRLWEDPRLARHLHLPLQSGCKKTLRRMARKITPEAFARLVKSARKAIPGIAITTDIIVGFPGEDETEFEQSLAFVEAMDFAGGHVFTYSPRPFTAAATMPNQVLYETRKMRNKIVQDVIAQSSRRYRSGFLGKRISVLWESAKQEADGSWLLSGLSDNYLRIHARAGESLWNRFSVVKPDTLTEKGLIGKIETET